MPLEVDGSNPSSLSKKLFSFFRFRRPSPALRKLLSMTLYNAVQTISFVVMPPFAPFIKSVLGG